MMCNTIGCINFDNPANLCGECTWLANKQEQRIADLEAELANKDREIDAEKCRNEDAEKMLTSLHSADMRELEAELAQQNCTMTKVCHWSIDSDYAWRGTCGIVWFFPEGTPKENDVNYCPQCGGVVMQQASEVSDV